MPTPPTSLARRLIEAGLEHLTLRDIAKLEECLGIEIGHVTQDDPPNLDGAPQATDDYSYSLAC